MTVNYAIADESEQEQAKTIISRLLTHDAVGKDNAVSSAVIASSCNVSASTVRDLIPELRQEFRLPIGSCSTGYFIIDSQKEFVYQVERQRKQAEKSLQTAREIARAWNRR